MKSEGEGRGGEQRRKERNDRSKNKNDRCLSTAYREEGYVQGELKKKTAE